MGCNISNLQSSLSLSSSSVVELLTPRRVPLRYLIKVLSNDKNFNHDSKIGQKIKDIVSCMKRRRLHRGTFLFRMNDDSKELYVCVKGLINLNRDDGTDLGTVGKGSIIGLPGFMNSSTRSANALAVKDAEVFCLNIDDYNRVIYHIIPSQLTPLDLKHYTIFYSLTDDEKRCIFSQLEIRYYKKNDIVININDESSYLIVIIAGFLQSQFFLYPPNTIIGIHEIIVGINHKTLVRAHTDCSCIFVKKEVFKKCLPHAYNYYCHKEKIKN